MTSLRDTLAAATGIFRDDGGRVDNVTPAVLGQVVDGVDTVEGMDASTGPTVVSVALGGDVLGFAALAEPGDCLLLRADMLPELDLTFGRTRGPCTGIDAYNGASAPSW